VSLSLRSRLEAAFAPCFPHGQSGFTAGFGAEGFGGEKEEGGFLTFPILAAVHTTETLRLKEYESGMGREAGVLYAWRRCGISVKKNKFKHSTASSQRLSRVHILPVRPL
jgi:hypothetical protein